MRTLLALLIWPLGLSACHKPDDSGPPDSADTGPSGDTSDTSDSLDDTGEPWPEPDPSTWKNVLSTPDDLGALMGEDGDVKSTCPILGLEREEPLTEDCYFQDMAVYPYHLFFLRAFPELRDLDTQTYEAWVVANDTRKWWGGSVRTWLGAIHPVTGNAGVLAYSFYADDSAGGPTLAMVEEVHARVEGCVPWAAAAGVLAWMPDGSAELTLADAEADALSKAGHAWLSPEQLLDTLPAEVVGEGEASAVLRLGEAGDGEILVAAVLPAKIADVAGIVVGAAEIDDPLLVAAAARGVPVAIVLDIELNGLVLALDGALVHLTLSGGRLGLAPTRPEESR